MARNKNKATKVVAQIVNDKEVGKGVVTADFFLNQLTNQGLEAPNQLSGTNYTRSRITRDFQLLITLYRSHWIIQKVIDLVANDMTKGGIKLLSATAPDELEKIQKCMKKRKVWSKLNEGVRWSRLFGGAGALMLIEGQEHILSLPLDTRSIVQGDFKGLLVFDRWSGIMPSMERVEDISSTEFGLPKYYDITMDGGRSARVHHSRILRFTGRPLPAWEKEVEQLWGISEIESIYEELVKRDNTSFNTAQLVFLANLRVLKKADLGKGLTLGDRKATQELYNTLQAQKNLMSNSGLFVVDKEDEFQTESYTFTGLSDILERFMSDISGASQIPECKLYGRSPAGMNATGESDLQNYYGMIEEKQEQCLRDNIEKLLPVVSMSELGYIPEDLDFDFESIESVSDDEVAEVVSKKTDSIIKAMDAGLITAKEGRIELEESCKNYGVFSNLDATITANADNTLGFNTPDFSDLNTGGEENGKKSNEVADAHVDVDENTKWITVKGSHIPIGKGVNIKEAIANFFKGKEKASKESKASSESYKGILKSVKESNSKPLTSNDIIEKALNNKELQDHLAKKGVTLSRELLNQRIKEAEDYVDKAPQTIEMYKNPKTGEYYKERKDLHKKILDKVFENEADAKPKDGKKPSLVMLGGRGGSGKSKFDGMVYDKKNYIVLDADAFKEELPDYQGYNAFQVHEESSELMKEALQRAKDKGLNVVIDGTMKTEKSVEKPLKEFSGAGYEVEMHYMHLPREVSAQRAIGRFLGKENGRYVPLDVLLSMKDNEENFDKMKKYAKKWSFYNNDVGSEGTPPKLIAQG